jgi:ribonuclease T1
VINEKGVVKNVSAATDRGMRAGMAASSLFRRGVASRVLAGLALSVAALVGAAGPSDALARSSAPGLGADVTLSSLSPQAQQTEQLIRAGGPFPYSRDGVVFGNREQRLPRQPRSYYREYTVPTPGARNRGARRIICGGTRPTEPDACFYTEDHYNSFHRIVK